ncbi:hypothetical protein BGZ94_003769 [Podila epigama]|nr:hypothetical protein BGZ94_003769 [Podila epigama]
MSTRSRRRPRKAQPINNAHYVGYVEENESIEAIMKKFEELARMEEEFKKAAATSTSVQGGGNSGSAEESPLADGELVLGVEKVNENAPTEHEGFTDEQLQEVFRRTSGFTVRSMLRDTPDDIYEEDVWQANIADEDYLYDFEEEDDYLMAMDDHFWDEEIGTSRKRGRKEREPKAPRERREPRAKGERRRPVSDRESILARYKVMQVRLQDRNGNYFTVKKKISAMDPSLPTYIRIPPVPIPRSWIHPIKSLEAPETTVPGTRYEETDNILGMDLKQFGTDYQVVYMDPPLLRAGQEAGPNKITIEQLATLDIGSIMSKGFLFVWIEKEFLPEIVQIAEQWQFRYVENFCWIKRNVNNVIAREPSPYFNSSKLSCLIFRKEGDVELRHQRSPDCVFDFIKPEDASTLSEEKPKFMYELIETLLPQAVYNESTNPNGDKMIELWARPGTRRRGWTSICQRKI